MVARLFAGTRPSPDATVLDPGCGDGVFVDGVLRWCRREGIPPPHIVGVEMHPERAENARERFIHNPTVQISEADFLGKMVSEADYVIGNPPYVPITQLSEEEKSRYRSTFTSASGRFDLYALFFERAIECLKPRGRLVFVTPQKYLSTASMRPLRALLARQTVREIMLLPEDTFPGFTTYPAVTVVDADSSHSGTRIERRDGSTGVIVFPLDGSPISLAASQKMASSGLVLEDITDRISCGVATGADRIFVQPLATLPTGLRPFARPTVSGRQLKAGEDPIASDAMLVPYDDEGTLLSPDAIGELGVHLAEPEVKKALLKRTCVRRKPWYAFHETPPMQDIFRPKLLCKDIADKPQFWIDREGSLLPRHSVYYIIPSDPERLDDLADVLNSDATAEWLMAHAQPAANGYRRLQSTILKRIPVPDTLASTYQIPLNLFEETANRQAEPLPA